LITRRDFPNGFLFGTATSAYQIEGHGSGGAGLTHWDSFAATPGNVVRAEHGQLACDHYHRFEQDLDLVAAAGFDTYRFSTSWARVMPEGRGPVNQEGLDFYDRLTDAMLERGLKPAATLYHWEMPSALEDQGGWRNRDVASWFGDFTDVIMGRIGDRMFSVAPINEPWCVGWLSHFEGAHAPGLRDIRATARAMHHVLCAHGTAIDRMRALGMTNLGAVCNFEYANPADDTADSAAAAGRYDAIYNRFFMGGIFHKTYPDLVLDGLEPHLPKGWESDFDLIGTPVDWCGINYYTRSNIAAKDGPWPNLQAVEGPLDKTQMGWESIPMGFMSSSCAQIGSIPKACQSMSPKMAWPMTIRVLRAASQTMRGSLILKRIFKRPCARSRRARLWWAIISGRSWTIMNGPLGMKSVSAWCMWILTP